MQHWDRIEAFVEVVRHESFAGAARNLGVSSSHVSRLVARLETQLGTQLLYRTTRRLRLTDAGAVYFEHCAQLFDGFQEALTAISDYQRRPTGVLKLTCATTFGEKFIAPLVNDFLAEHPQLSVRMDFTNRPVDIVDEGFDVAIRTGALQAALLELDDAAVFTIHSFCNNVLSDMAFTSAAPLELALATDTRAMYLQGCEDFIRKVSRDEEAFAQLASHGWHTPEQLLRDFLPLMEFAKAPHIASEQQINKQFDAALNNLAEQYQPQARALYTALVDNESLFLAAVINNDEERAREWQVILDWLQNGPLTDIPEELGKFINGNRYRAKREGIVEAKALVEPAKTLRTDLTKAVDKLAKSRQALLDKAPVYAVVCEAVAFVRDYVSKQKQRLSTVDFNDLIRLLAAQIDTPDSPLCVQLRQRYPVALVDEFQDTDADQYHILANVYPGQDGESQMSTTLLMIGDPKQAIYGFRGGDIFTYLQAAEQAEYRWVMDTNWRSVKPVVDAYNRLFWGAAMSQSRRDLFNFGITYLSKNNYYFPK